MLAAEQIMAAETDGRGWARNMLANLCIDLMGAVMTTCERDGTRESYLAPADHRVEMRLIGARAAVDLRLGVRRRRRARRALTTARAARRCASGSPTASPRPSRSTVAVPNAPPQRAVTEVAVRDLLIAGLGDSIAAGEGNPDRPVALSDEGFCFRRFGTGSEYYRPGRATFKGDRTCEAGHSPPENLAEWSQLGARWMSQACHRSLYSYQLRTALALAVENPHVAVTFLPLACTGATIENGVLGSQRARELNCTPDRDCPSTVTAQVTQLQQYLADRAAHASGPQSRSRAAHRRGERHRFLRAGRERHHRFEPRARAVRRERDLVGRSPPKARSTRTLPAEFREAAHRAQADGRRRPLARGVRLLRPSGAARRRRAVRRRAGGLRRASLVQARRRADAPRRGFRRRALPAALKAIAQCANCRATRPIA